MSMRSVRCCLWLGSTILMLMAAMFVSVWFEALAFGLPAPLRWAGWGLAG